MANLAARLIAWPQYLLPQQLLTTCAWRISTCRTAWFKNFFIRTFVSLFHVNLEEAERTEPEQYDCFNDFFTRTLKPGARPSAPAEHQLISPCDGTVSQLGRLEAGRIIQAKGLDYSVERLIGNRDWAQRFADGRFITIYLAPNDYHRVHMPLSGRLLAEHRIPGRLFSVSAATTRAVPNLFARNERMVALFDTDHGPVAVIMVAALLVAGIETPWGGPQQRRPEREARWTDFDTPVTLARGAEMGRFHWGSTVIILTPDDFPDWRTSLAPGRRVRLGQALTN
ncbi:MAG: phosphatidylserine decarboxylase [Wenzhouxiangella sp.]|nr:MAG: phosphatidylserine decarboxylase [Wenzhouxiangella sp.]